MKIIELQAENVKKLVAVEIRPDGNLVEITGRNGQGKSSVLDAIWWALAGTTNIQAVPIRKGADEARIRLDLGEIKVTRTFRRRDDETYTTSIIVENAEGARFPSPQTMLDKLLGALSFDPLAFTRLEERKQFETLKRFVPGVDFAAIEKANRADYEKRTDINRRAKEARTRGEAIKLAIGEEPSRVDEEELVAHLEGAGRVNADIEARRMRREQAVEEKERLARAYAETADRVKRLREEADKLEQAAAVHLNAAVDIQEKLAAAPPLADIVDTAEITRRITEARATNARIDTIERERAERNRLLATAKALEEDSAALTKAMAEREAEKLAAIAAAKMPVDGLSFGDGVVLLNDLPFDQASSAEQLRASVAIAMAMNSGLRVVRVQDGSLLDQDSIRIIAEMADEADCQVWLERVDSSGKVGIVLEDGRVKAPAPLLEAAE